LTTQTRLFAPSFFLAVSGTCSKKTVFMQFFPFHGKCLKKA
jgi:hypothetical protein